MARKLLSTHQELSTFPKQVKGEVSNHLSGYEEQSGIDTKHPARVPTRYIHHDTLDKQHRCSRDELQSMGHPSGE
jgi:hypothetical protein